MPGRRPGLSECCDVSLTATFAVGTCATSEIISLIRLHVPALMSLNEARLLNHSSTRFNDKQKVFYRNSFVNRYIFPDGELTGTAKVMMAMTGENWEVFHEENLRHHYAKTLHAWRMTLEDHWDEAVTEVGERKSRVWRLYMAVSEFGFARNVIQLHQFLGVNTTDEGVSRPYCT